jgi:ABC-type nitrate/sulfonate/bicarbonate transport system substrate-binding protein
MRDIWRLLALVAALAPVLALGGCGGDDEGGGAGGGEQGSSSIRVLETAGIPSAFLTYGVERGFFEQEGLDVKVQPSQGGAEAIPAIVSGDVQVAGSNAVSVLLATTEGLDLRMIAPGTFARPQKDFSAIMVSSDGPIRAAQDLEGKRIAVNTLKNVTEVTAREALAKEGVDPSSLRLTEIPFPEMAQAVAKGDVDAAFLIEPFVTVAEKEGLRTLARPYNDTQQGLQVGSYVAQSGYAEENADVVEGFAKGVARTAEAIEQEPEQFRSFLHKASELPPEAAKAVTLPKWGAQSDRESLDLLADLMVKYRLAKEEPAVDELLQGSER